MPRPSNSTEVGSGGQWFTTTHWSVVGAAGGLTDASKEALEKLCRTYWPPLYSYVRRWGYRPEDAQDMTQAFFARLLEKNFWARADRQKGRFRSFLLTALRQFLADERDRAKTIKRGGGVPLIPLDEQTGEDSFVQGLNRNLSGEQQFDRQWASTVLQQARDRLREECIGSGKATLYERVNLLGDEHDRSAAYADLAKELGMSVSAIKSTVSRWRERYGELVREEVAH